MTWKDVGYRNACDWKYIYNSSGFWSIRPWNNPYSFNYINYDVWIFFAIYPQGETFFEHKDCDVTSSGMKGTPRRLQKLKSVLYFRFRSEHGCKFSFPALEHPPHFFFILLKCHFSHSSPNYNPFRREGGWNFENKKGKTFINCNGNCNWKFLCSLRCHGNPAVRSKKLELWWVSDWRLAVKALYWGIDFPFPAIVVCVCGMPVR